jgi:hypothetical protein
MYYVVGEQQEKDNENNDSQIFGAFMSSNGQ